jgi:hypothetical protein
VDPNKELQLHVHYLRPQSPQNTGRYIFPPVRDEDFVNVCTIEAILKKPKLERRGELYFEDLKDMDL